jgi:hypothetical protein
MKAPISTMPLKEVSVENDPREGRANWLLRPRPRQLTLGLICSVVQEVGQGLYRRLE